ncbi:hypothetical protein MMC25_007645 [Agyrium rufum]|nr:hypothetical protein [Agyrium rufum]
MASKILVLGSINGYIAPILEKVEKLHAKNNFAFALVLGDLFSDPGDKIGPDAQTELNSLIRGKLFFPLPTYFNVGKHALPEQVIEKLKQDGTGEVAPNLYFLGKRSITKTSEGIRIVALGGQLDSNITGLSKDKYLPFYTDADAKSLAGAHSADILITSSWPSSIRAGSNIKAAPELEDSPSEQCVAELCSTLKPRYHFSSWSEFFYEREPFYHLPSETHPEIKPVTRFISLASTSNPTKQKSIYAFSLDPSAPLSATLPPGSTPSPLLRRLPKRPLPDQNTSFSRFATSASNGGYRGHHGSGKRQRKNDAPLNPSECFFCLSNPNASTHIVISIADDAYLTTAKGSLTTRKTFPSLSLPCHILIIPLAHYPTFASIPDPEIRTSAFNEMQRYRSALQTMVSKQSKGNLGAVTWEISRERGVHVHWQFLAVERKMVERGLVEAAFKVEAENEKYPSLKTKDIGDGTKQEGDFFRVWIWMPSAEIQREKEDGERKIELGEEIKSEDGGDDEEKEEKRATNLDAKGDTGDNLQKDGVEKQLVLSINSSSRFDLQYGRKVMAKLMGLEKRFDWRECAQSQEEEKQDADDFKKIFKDFDFSLEDED